MNTHVQHLWLDALARYTQTEGALRDGDAFCVGGVLCDLHSHATGFPWEEQQTPDGEVVFAYLGSHALPPKAVLMWAQLHEDDFVPLLDANDAGKTFAELAERIQAL